MKKLVVLCTIVLSGCSTITEYSATKLTDYHLCQNYGKAVQSRNREVLVILDKEMESRGLSNKGELRDDCLQDAVNGYNKGATW